MERIKTVLLIALMFAFTSGVLVAQSYANPFVGGRPSPSQNQIPDSTAQNQSDADLLAAPAAPSVSPFAQLGQWLTGVQFSMRELMVDAAYRLRDGQFLQLFYLCLLSFLYGVFHALGPGHGKTLVSSFFLARPGRIRQAVGIAWSVALVHALVAIGIVLLFTQLIQQVLMVGIDQAGAVISSAASLVIILLGGLMLASALVTIISGGKKHLHLHWHPHKHDHHHDHEHEHEHEHGQQKPVTLKELWLVAVLSSIVPCPGAATLMAFAIAAQIPLAGAIAVAAMSLGVGITTGAAGIVAILAQRGVTKLTIHRMPRLIPLIGGFFRLTGSLLIIVSGIILIGAPIG